MDLRLGGELEKVEDEDKDLFEFIARLEAATVRKLFKACRWSCLGVLQRLSPLGRQLALRLVPIHQSVPRSFFTNSIADAAPARAALKETMTQMEELKVLVATGDGTFVLQDEFRAQIAAALVEQDTSQLPWQEPGVQAKRVDAAQMEASAREKWTAILHFIVGSAEYSAPSKRVVKLLTSMGLMRYGDDLDRPRITRLGYHFMLRDIHNQLWLFIRHYTEQVDNPDSVLQMLFKMNYCAPGTPCSTSQLDETQRGLLDDFELFGLIYRGPKEARVFYPTSLGVNVVFGQSREEKMAAAARAVDIQDENSAPPTATPGSGPDPKRKRGDGSRRNGDASAGTSGSDLYIITETNFKLYAYTQSSLHIEMVKLFAEPECILPNMLVAVVTRSSIRSAFKLGVTADQIIGFLTDHAHPLCEHRHRKLPDNVSDQILLWYMERNRVFAQTGLLLDKFAAGEDALFEACVKHAEKRGWLLYSCPKPMSLVVQAERRDEIKQFIKAHKAGAHSSS